MPRKKQEIAEFVAPKRPMPPDFLFSEESWFKPIAPAGGVAEWVNESLRIRPRTPVIEQTSLMADDSPIATTGGYSCRKRRSCLGTRRV